MEIKPSTAAARLRPALETFLGGMEIPSRPHARPRPAYLETFLGGMEISVTEPEMNGSVGP